MRASVGRSWPEIAAAALAVAAAAYVAGPGAAKTGFPLDDAWIHMVYGLELVRHHALAYNDGVPATGSTAPLWSLAAALAHVLVGASGPSLAAACALKCLSASAHVAAAVLAARCARLACADARLEAAAGLAAGALVAACPVLAYAAVSGMEVSLAAALMLAALLAGTRARAAWAGALLGLAVAARPESLTIGPCLLLSLGAGGARPGGPREVMARGGAAVRQGLRRMLVAAGLVAAAAGGLVARNLAVSGRPLPSTFYAKVSPTWDRVVAEVRIDHGLGEMLGGLAPTSARATWWLAGIAVVAWMLALVRSLARTGESTNQCGQEPHAGLAAAGAGGSAALGGLAFAVATSLALRASGGPNDFYFQRYFAPSIPLLIVGAVSGAATVGELLLRRLSALTSRSPVRRAVQAAAILAASTALFAEAGDLPEFRERYVTCTASIDAVQVEVGRWMATETPPDGVVWSMDAGAPRYWSQRRLVDLLQLNTPELVDDRGEIARAYAADAVALYGRMSVTIADDAVAPVLGLPRGASEPYVQKVWRCASAGAGGAARLVVKAGTFERSGWCRSP